MNYKKKTRLVTCVTIVLTMALLCGFAFTGAYAANQRISPVADIMQGNNTTTPSATQRYALLEVYSSDNQKICEITDEEILVAFNQNTAFEEDILTLSDEEYISKMQDIQRKLEDYEIQYTITSYKTPVAENNDGSLERISDIILYKGTNMIAMKVSPDVIKGVYISPENLTSYYEISDEKITFLFSLADGGMIVTEDIADNKETTPQYSIGDPRITKVEIYSDDRLINTILEQEQLDEFHESAIEIEEIYFGNEDILKTLKQTNRIVAYKTDTSIFGKETFQEMFSYVLYYDTNIMKITSNEMPLPIYYEATDDALNYLHSLIPKQ